MENEAQKSGSDLSGFLSNLSGLGIQTDRRLLLDMTSQFKDYNEWVREYCVNSSDALATHCRIWGEEDGENITIIVSDNGKGMNRQGVEDFFTLYRSRKHGPAEKAVGRHGIGKLSAAAIPGQSGFEMRTSNGEEYWVAKTGSLIADAPIIPCRMEPVPPPGTEFRITFKKTIPLEQEMIKLSDVLKKYLSFLDMLIEITIPSGDEDNYHPTWFINKTWPGRTDGFFRQYHIKIRGMSFNITMGLGVKQHVIFQNKVLITDKYNLISYGQHEQWEIHGLFIMVDSPDFELPFGRHCLSNEDVLEPLANRIRTRLLVDFYRDLQLIHDMGEFHRDNNLDYSFNMLTSCLLFHNQGDRLPWIDTPVFRLVNKKMVSLRELIRFYDQHKRLFIADPKMAGIDFEVFKMVLDREQMYGLEKTLKKLFAGQMIDLGCGSLVMEKPDGSRSELSELELSFEQHLGFSLNGLYRFSPRELEEMVPKGQLRSLDYSLNNSFYRESLSGRDLLQSLGWRVNYLVGYDGKTPAKSHLFIFDGDTVVMNLNHQDIANLVKLSKTDALLAAHWAMAICLLDEQNILPEVTPETREDLLMIDAISRIKGAGQADQHGKGSGHEPDEWMDDLDDFKWN